MGGIHLSIDCTKIILLKIDIELENGIAGQFATPRLHRMEREGVRPCTIIEITSPLFVEADLVDKVAIYEQAVGVPEYFIVDACDSEMTDANSPIVYNVIGYRLVNRRYVKLEPNEQGHHI